MGMNILNTQQVQALLKADPGSLFSLQRIRVKFTDGPGYLVAGYHIHAGHLPGMIHVTGPEIWKYVQEPPT